MSRRTAIVALFAASLALPRIGPAATEETAAEGAAEIKLPLTIAKVWYRREGRGGFGGASASGDLTITPDELKFVTRKKELDLPLESVHMLGLGRMPGDVDTEWVLLVAVQSGARRTYGFRDGSKAGYGQKTREIYDTLRAAFRQLSVAQYAVPEGYRSYDELSDLFVIAVPEGWSSYHHSVTASGGEGSWGTVVLTAQRLATRDDPEGSKARVRQMHDGKLEAVLIDRRKAAKGMTCEGFTDKGRDRLLAWVAEEPLLGEDYELLGEPELVPTQVDGCDGLRVRARARNVEGDEVLLDLRTVASGATAFLLALRGPAGGSAGTKALFEEMVGTFRLAPTR
jgi:hypothetical protein